MKNQIETYEVEEIAAETHEECAEATALINELGLSGQQQKEPSEKRLPYRRMTKEEEFVYSNLCPAKTEARLFNTEPIPLQVLKTMAFAKTVGFTYFEVWAAESAKVKDPVLLGKLAGGSSWSGEYYILARWGAELMPLTVLLPDALKVWHAKRRDHLRKIRAEVDALLSETEAPESTPESLSMPCFIK